MKTIPNIIVVMSVALFIFYMGVLSKKSDSEINAGAMWASSLTFVHPDGMCSMWDREYIVHLVNEKIIFPCCGPESIRKFWDSVHTAYGIPIWDTARRSFGCFTCPPETIRSVYKGTDTFPAKYWDGTIFDCRNGITVGCSKFCMQDTASTYQIITDGTSISCIIDSSVFAPHDAESHEPRIKKKKKLRWTEKSLPNWAPIDTTLITCGSCVWLNSDTLKIKQ